MQPRAPESNPVTRKAIVNMTYYGCNMILFLFWSVLKNQANAIAIPGQKKNWDPRTLANPPITTNRH